MATCAVNVSPNVYFFPTEYLSYGAGGTANVVMKQNPQGDWYKEYRIADHLGSVRVSIANGAVNTYDYEPFGAPVASEPPRSGFIDKEKDAENGLGDFGVRKYDDDLGRFLSVDPLWEKFRSQTPYHYSYNNPLGYKDATGLAGGGAQEHTKKQANITPIVDETGGAVAPGAVAAMGKAIVSWASQVWTAVKDKIMQTAPNAAEKVEKVADLTRQSVDDKLQRYLLNPDHPIGKAKAEWFDKALGFTKDNASELAKQIVFDPNSAIKTQITEHGTKYNQTISITGTNGKTIDVVFAWIQNNDNVVRLVSGIPTKK